MKVIVDVARFILFVAVIALTLGIIGAIVAAVLMSAPGTEVEFQSSDGRWASREELAPKRGYTFERGIVRNFVEFRLSCDLTDVTLQRITPQPSPVSLESWFNDYDDLKWRVPLAARLDPPARGTGLELGFCHRKRQPSNEEIAREVQALLSELSQNNAMHPHAPRRAGEHG